MRSSSLGARVVGVAAGVAVLAAAGVAGADAVLVVDRPVELAAVDDLWLQEWSPTFVNDAGDVVAGPVCCGGSALVWEADGTVTDLGEVMRPLGWTVWEARDLNDRREVAMILSSPDTAAVLDLDDRSVRVLASPPGSRAGATTIDESGVVGGGITLGGVSTPTIWYPDGRVQSLDGEGIVTDLGAGNRAVGQVGLAGGYHAVVWDLTDGTMTDLTPTATVPASPSELTDRGEVLVEYAGSGSTVIDLATGTAVLETEASGLALNDAGEVAFVEGSDPWGERDLVVLDLDTGVRRTHPVIGPTGLGLNDRGQVIFTSRVDGPSSPPHAIVWDPGAGVLDLGAGLAGHKINDRGDVAGETEPALRPWRARVRVGETPAPTTAPPTSGPSSTSPSSTSPSSTTGRSAEVATPRFTG